MAGVYIFFLSYFLVFHRVQSEIYNKQSNYSAMLYGKEMEDVCCADLQEMWNFPYPMLSVTLKTTHRPIPKQKT